MITRSIPKVLAVLFLSGMLACGKGGDDGGGSTAKADVRQINNNLTPGEVFIFQPSFSLTGNSWTISVAGKPTTLFRVSDSTVGFLAPYIAAGTVQVDFSALQQDGLGTKSVNIAPYTQVANPATTIATYKTELNEALADVRSTMPERAAAFEQIHAAFNRLSAGLSTAEQQELAFYLQKLSFELPDPPLMPNSAGGQQIVALNALINVPSSIPSDHEYYKAWTSTVSLGIMSAAGLLTAIPVLGAPDPTLISQVAAVAALGASVYVGFKAIDYFFLAYRYEGKATTFTSGISIQSQQVANTRTGTVALDGVKTDDVTLPESGMLYNNTAALLKADITYHSLTTADRGKGYLGKAITTMETMVKRYEQVTNLIKTVAKWFSANPTIAPMSITIPQTANTATRPAPGDLLRIENISNAAVTFSVKAVDNGIEIRPSTTLKTKESIAFDLVYEHKNLGITTRTKVTTVLDAREFSVDGTWEIKKIMSSDPGDPYTINGTMIMYPNSTMLYYFNTGGEFKVSQVGNTYFLYMTNDVGWGNSDFKEKWRLSADRKNLILTVRNDFHWRDSGSFVTITHPIKKLSDTELEFEGPPLG